MFVLKACEYFTFFNLNIMKENSSLSLQKVLSQMCMHNYSTWIVAETYT